MVNGFRENKSFSTSYLWMDSFSFKETAKIKYNKNIQIVNKNLHNFLKKPAISKIS